MNISREQLSKTRVKLTIDVDASALADAEQVALIKLKKDLKVPGFRKGKVPVTVAKKNIDPNSLAQETAENAISKSVAEAFAAEQIQVLDRPEVEVIKFVPGKELSYTAEADMIPAVKLGDYKKLAGMKKPSFKVEKSEVDEVVGRIVESMAEKKEVKRAAKDGDEVVIDFNGKKDDKEFDGGKAEDHSIVLGSNSFIPGFEEAIVGHKAGEEFDVPLKFPDDYHAKELAGQDVVFAVKLKKVTEVVTPELTDEIAAKAGEYTSAKELLADIERELSTQKEREYQNELKDELVKQLVDKSDVEAPQLLIDDQVKSIEQDMVQNLMYQGVSLDQYLEQKGFASKDEWIEKEARQTAEFRVKAGLTLSELTKVKKITATEEELKAQLAEMQQQYASRPEMAGRFDEPEVQREVANRLLTDKTLDLLVELNSKK